jgi:hypothetical protein
MEMDIVSSYGYAASTLSAPTGFSKGFMGTEQGLCAIDRWRRYRSFEFLSVFYTLWLAISKWNIKVKSVFSNYHAFGIFFVGPYPVDLAIIDTRGRVMLFNYDGQFCHGCTEGCPPLVRYASGKSRTEVEEATRQRDVYIQKWVDAIGSRVDQQAVSYTVVASCHDQDYHMDSLLSHFEKVDELAALMQPYRDIEKFTNELTSQDPIEQRLAKCPENATYILVAQCGEIGNGGIEGPGHSGPLFVCPYSEAEGETSKLYHRQRRTNGPNEWTVLTKDYFNYLASTRGTHFKIDRIQGCLVYPKWNGFNEVFRQLVQLRNRSDLSTVEKQLVKNIVNFSCGYFGLNQIDKAAKPVMRLGTRISKRADVLRTEIKPENGDEFDDVCYDVICTARRVPKKLVSSTPVPLYLSVVEIGKLRLIQILDWLEKYSAPGTCRHLYTNVDNLIVALSVPDLDALPLPQHCEEFQLLKERWMALGPSGKPEPGGLKLEWRVGPQTNWKFATFALQNWCVITDNVAEVTENRSKTNLFPGVDARQAYEFATTLIDMKTVVLQQRRRINKMVNTDEHLVTYKFCPK